MFWINVLMTISHDWHSNHSPSLQWPTIHSNCLSLVEENNTKPARTSNSFVLLRSRCPSSRAPAHREKLKTLWKLRWLSAHNPLPTKRLQTWNEKFREASNKTRRRGKTTVKVPESQNFKKLITPRQELNLIENPTPQSGLRQSREAASRKNRTAWVNHRERDQALLSQFEAWGNHSWKSGVEADLCFYLSETYSSEDI